MSEYDAIVPLEKMPPCPICGKPIRVPAQRDDPFEDRLMIFFAHDQAALAHDGCRVVARGGQ